VITVVLVRQFSRADGATVPRSLAQLTFGPDLQGDPAWSPDGRRVAFASDRQGNSNIWVQELSQPEPIRVTSSPARDWQPDWSPDGGWIVYRSEQEGGGLYIVAAEGGAARRLSAFGTHPRWSPSGDLILFSNATSRTGARKLYVVDPKGGAPREVAADVIEPLTSSIWASVAAAWHPDGRRISVWGRLPDGRWTFATVNVATGTTVNSRLPDSGLRDLDRQRVRLGRFVWAPSARFLYFEGQGAETRNIWRVGVEPSTLSWTGTPGRLTTDVGEEADLALSPEGTRLAFTVRTQRTSVWALDFDPRLGQLTGHEQAFTTGSAGQVDLDTPRDGSRLAYRSVRAGRSEMWEVRTADREGASCS
jgi:Tol biopolymer transport system component